MSTSKVRKKRAGSAQESKKLDDGATTTTRRATDVDTVHPLWEKVINDEIRDNLCLQIREEVFETLFQICYEKYLEKQVIDFTVHCAHQAFLKVASVYFIKLDPGEKLMKENPSWTPDKEPVPSRMDPWLSYTVPVVERKPEEPAEPSTPTPSPATQPSPSSKLADEKDRGLLAQQVYARYQPSTEWPPEAVESVLRHSEEPARLRPLPEEPPKEKPKRPSASSRKPKDAAPPSKPVQADSGELRRAKLPPIKSKSDVKKTKSGERRPSTMEIPRPPVIPISALPPTRRRLIATNVHQLVMLAMVNWYGTRRRVQECKCFIIDTRTCLILTSSMQASADQGIMTAVYQTKCDVYSAISVLTLNVQTSDVKAIMSIECQTTCDLYSAVSFLNPHVLHFVRSVLLVR